jgi:hypothetical protein
MKKPAEASAQAGFYSLGLGLATVATAAAAKSTAGTATTAT